MIFSENDGVQEVICWDGGRNTQRMIFFSLASNHASWHLQNELKLHVRIQSFLFYTKIQHIMYLIQTTVTMFTGELVKVQRKRCSK